MLTLHRDDLDEDERRDLPYWIVSLDPGKSQDPSALTITRVHVRDEDDANFYEVVHAQEWPLKTLHTTVRDDIGVLMLKPQLAGRVVLVIDQGGVGNAVIELYQGRAAFSRARIVGVMFTGGDNPTEDAVNDVYKVPKHEIVDNMLVILQLGRLRIHEDIPECRKIWDQFAAFKIKRDDQTGRMRFQAAEGEHDDLVTSLAQGLWIGEHVWEPEIG